MSEPAMSPVGAAGVVALVRQCGAPLPAVRVPLAEALGGILREPVCATEDQPAFDRSAMDGYAILRDDPSASFRLVDEIRAGEWKPRTLRLGETVRVATGAALPGTGLQVVMREQARVEAAQVWLAERGEETNIRPQGQDAARGEVLVPSGTVLRPGTLALLASLGHAHPLVTRPLRVLQRCSPARRWCSLAPCPRSHARRRPSLSRTPAARSAAVFPRRPTTWWPERRLVRSWRRPAPSECLCSTRPD